MKPENVPGPGSYRALSSIGHQSLSSFKNLPAQAIGKAQRLVQKIVEIYNFIRTQILLLAHTTQILNLQDHNHHIFHLQENIKKENQILFLLQVITKSIQTNLIEIHQITHLDQNISSHRLINSQDQDNIGL